MATPHVAMDVEIPSDVKYIEGVVELATRKCRELRVPARKCSLNVRIALSEALSNAILRGNGEAPDKHVRVRATVNKETLVFDVFDEGTGFDLHSDRPDPTAPENLMSEDGRGIFLMQKLMDGVEQYRDNGNVIRLILKLE